MHAMRIPSTSLDAVAGDAVRRSSGRSRRFPEVAFVFSKTGTAEIASDPMPPNVSDTFIILKPRDRVARPGPAEGRAGASASRRRCGSLPGNNYEFTQPIQMRFNELIAGVRGDVAVKVFGDDFEPMLAAANQIAGVLRGIAGRRRRAGRAGRRACPSSTSRSTRRRSPRRGPQRRRRAGRDRRPPSAAARPAWSSRATGASRSSCACPTRCAPISRRCATCPSRCRGEAPGGRRAATVPLAEPRRASASPKGRTRSAARTASGASSCRPTSAAATSARFVAEAQARVAREVPLPAGHWLDWGGQFENLAAARAAPDGRRARPASS